MEACIDDVFKEIAEGLEVHVDQSQLEEKIRGAVSAPPQPGLHSSRKDAQKK